jgi:hypothetical protein
VNIKAPSRSLRAFSAREFDSLVTWAGGPGYYISRLRRSINLDWFSIHDLTVVAISLGPFGPGSIHTPMLPLSFQQTPKKRPELKRKRL